MCQLRTVKEICFLLSDSRAGEKGEGARGTEYRGPARFEESSHVNARKTFFRCNVQYLPAG